MARVAEKPALIYVRTTKAPLLFAIARFFSTKKLLTNLNGEQNDTGNLLVSHRICHFRAIQPFEFYTDFRSDLLSAASTSLITLIQ